jgi:uncharacterized membrane protein
MRNRTIQALIAFWVCGVVMLLLDLIWLGVVARDFYRQQLGSLLRPQALWSAGLAFYVMYVGAMLKFAVVEASRPADAAKRGAGLGFVCYATYELTNLALIRDWPPALVAVDIIWGILLTALAAWTGKSAYDKVGRTMEKKTIT